MGLNRENPVLDPLAIQHLNKRLFMNGPYKTVLCLNFRSFFKFKTFFSAGRLETPTLAVRPASALLAVRPESSLFSVRPDSSLKAAPKALTTQNFDWESPEPAYSNYRGSSSIVKQERLEPEAQMVNVKKERFESYQEEVSQQASNATEEEESYDDLTVDELVSLFQNFKELDKENQEQLIIYMKKLETSNPDKVALIKFKIQGINF